MPISMRASCLVFALVVAGPAVAQQDRMATKEVIASRVAQNDKTFSQGWGLPAGYQKACGGRFVCYNGIPLQCGSNTRPYQNVADHQCLCVRDGCPQ